MPVIKLRVPAEVLETAKRAAQSFDYDRGGYYSFGPIDPDGWHYFTADCSDEYAAAFPVLKANPEMLHASIALDFAERFATDPVPSVEDVTAFCAAVEIVI